MAVNTKDKYYTPDWLVEHTIKKAIEIIGKENIREIVEPSAGDGAFIEPLKKAFPDLKQRYYDLYPEHPEVIEQNYKEVRLTYKKGRLTIGNPPFGTSSSLWKAFCKKAATNSDYIVFISPASQYNSNYYFKEGELVYSELLNDVEYRGSEVEGGKNQKVRTCLNIYKVYDREGSEDWRLQRLEQDVLIKEVRRSGKNKEFDADFYIGHWGAGAVGKMFNEIHYEGQMGVKILNENRRKEIEDFFKTYNFKDNLSYTGAGVYVDWNILKQYLIKHLYPTREERLEQDVLINSDEPDYYITYWGDAGYVCKEKKCNCSWGIKLLNEDIKKRFEEIKDKIEPEVNKHPSLGRSGHGAKRITEVPMKEVLIKLLYPTREERLEQDVLIERDNKSNKYDFIIDRRGWNLGKLLDKPEGRSFYGIKVLNENMRTNIESAIKQLEIDFKIKAENDLRSLSMPEVKQQLIKHLYPTREERLEQDISFSGNSNTGKTGQYYICQMGDAGFVCKEHRWASEYTININNEDIRQKFEQSFDLIKELIQKHTATGVSSGGSKHTNLNVVKEVLMKALYDDDPSFDSYDDIYPEVKKPIKIERAQFAKPLFEESYIEEIVKAPVDSSTMKAVALF